MPPVFRPSWVTWLLLSSLLACKPKTEDNASLKEAIAVESGPNGLKEFDYKIGARTVGFLGSRLGDRGCHEAAHWLVAAKNKDLPAAVKTIAGSDRVYETAYENLLDVHWSWRACSDTKPQPKEDGAGIKMLSETMTAKGFGLTVVVIGGIGSLFTPDGPIAEARAEWAKIPNVQVKYISLGDITDMTLAGKRLADEWDKVVLEGGISQRYLVWAFDVAGNLALDSMAENELIKNGTIGLVTVGSPLGGVVKTVFADKIKQQLGNVSTTVSQVVPSALSSNVAKFSGAVAALASLTPEARAKQLAAVKARNYSRDPADGLGAKIHVFHVASAIDPANLAPLPVASVKGGQLVAAMTTRQTEQALLVPFLASLKDDPLGDGLVALQNAVLPRRFTPEGIETHLVALTTFDHFGLQLTRRADDKPNQTPPYAKIVDAIMESIGSEMGSFVDKGGEGQ